MQKFYNKTSKDEVLESSLQKDDDGNNILPVDVVEISNNNPFLSAIPKGKQLTYDASGIPDGLENRPSMEASLVEAKRKRKLRKSASRRAEDLGFDSSYVSLLQLKNFQAQLQGASLGPKAQEDSNAITALWAIHADRKDSGSTDYDFDVVGDTSKHSYSEVQVEPLS